MSSEGTTAVSAGSAELAKDGMLTVAGAVAFSGMTRSRVFELMADNRLLSVKVGRQRLISKRSLLDLLAAEIDRQAGR